ncbi:cobalt-precorrin-6A reductase [Mesorhizobium atlanticum]
MSLAGRTESPVAQGVPVSVGGFGGVAGLAAYLRQAHVDLPIDATHPYAARISANAADAAIGSPVFRSSRCAVPAGNLSRAIAGRWSTVSLRRRGRLGPAPRRVFLAIGRQEAGAFEAAPQHRYLIRSVDPVEPKLAVPDARYLLARGPFPEADERALLEKYDVDVIVSKNSGGEATYGKIAAARALGIEVVMVRRPFLPDVPLAETVDALAAMVDHLFDPVAERGV